MCTHSKVSKVIYFAKKRLPNLRYLLHRLKFDIEMLSNAELKERVRFK